MGLFGVLLASAEHTPFTVYIVDCHIPAVWVVCAAAGVVFDVIAVSTACSVVYFAVEDALHRAASTVACGVVSQLTVVPAGVLPQHSRCCCG